jgi:nucleoside 2-deoxyribosyltransferase
MGLLQDTKCYLAGPVEHDETATSWRQDVAVFLSKLGVKAYDPLIKPPWLDQICHANPSAYGKVMQNGPLIDNGIAINEEAVIEANHMMRTVDLRIVHAVDWVICYLPKIFTSGTFEEVYEALRVNKPVYFCCPNKIPSTWLLAAAARYDDYKEYFFDNWIQLKDHVLMIDKGCVSLDPIRWVFLAWRKENWTNPLKKPRWR